MKQIFRLGTDEKKVRGDMGNKKGVKIIFERLLK